MQFAEFPSAGLSPPSSPNSGISSAYTDNQPRCDAVTPVQSMCKEFSLTTGAGPGNAQEESKIKTFGENRIGPRAAFPLSPESSLQSGEDHIENSQQDDRSLLDSYQPSIDTPVFAGNDGQPVHSTEALPPVHALGDDQGLLGDIAGCKHEDTYSELQNLPDSCRQIPAEQTSPTAAAQSEITANTHDLRRLPSTDAQPSPLPLSSFDAVRGSAELLDEKFHPYADDYRPDSSPLPEGTAEKDPPTPRCGKYRKTVLEISTESSTMMLSSQEVAAGEYLISRASEQRPNTDRVAGCGAVFPGSISQPSEADTGGWEAYCLAAADVNKDIAPDIAHNSPKLRLQNDTEVVSPEILPVIASSLSPCSNSSTNSNLGNEQIQEDTENSMTATCPSSDVDHQNTKVPEAKGRVLTEDTSTSPSESGLAKLVDPESAPHQGKAESACSSDSSFEIMAAQNPDFMQVLEQPPVVGGCSQLDANDCPSAGSDEYTHSESTCPTVVLSQYSPASDQADAKSDAHNQEAVLEQDTPGAKCSNCWQDSDSGSCHFAREKLHGNTPLGSATAVEVDGPDICASMPDAGSGNSCRDYAWEQASRSQVKCPCDTDGKALVLSHQSPGSLSSQICDPGDCPSQQNAFQDVKSQEQNPEPLLSIDRETECPDDTMVDLDCSLKQQPRTVSATPELSKQVWTSQERQRMLSDEIDNGCTEIQDELDESCSLPVPTDNGSKRKARCSSPDVAAEAKSSRELPHQDLQGIDSHIWNLSTPSSSQLLEESHPQTDCPLRTHHTPPRSYDSCGNADKAVDCMLQVLTPPLESDERKGLTSYAEPPELVDPPPQPQEALSPEPGRPAKLLYQGKWLPQQEQIVQESPMSDQTHPSANANIPAWCRVSQPTSHPRRRTGLSRRTKCKPLHKQC